MALDTPTEMTVGALRYAAWQMTEPLSDEMRGIIRKMLSDLAKGFEAGEIVLCRTGAVHSDSEQEVRTDLPGN